MENQDVALQSEACLSLKKRLQTSIWEDVSPLLKEVLKLSRHPTEEDAVLELSRSELLFVALLQALRTKNSVMSARLLLEVDDWKVLPRLSFYFGHKLNVEFNCPGDFFSNAAEFAHTLRACGLFRVPEQVIEYLDHLGQCMKKEIEARSSRNKECSCEDLQAESDSAQEESANVRKTRRITHRRRNSGTNQSEQAQGSRAEMKEATESLQAAVWKNDLATARSAIERGADLERRSWGWTPLDRAAADGHLGLIEVLLKAGAELEAVDPAGNRPLHRAAANGKDEAVVYLVDAGADIHAADNEGRTPLQRASYFNHKSTIRLLRSLGAQW